MNRFSDKTFEHYYSELFDSIKFKIAAESDDYIITQPIEDLIKYYTSNCLNPVEFDLDREESLDHQKYIKTIYANQRESGYRNEGDLKMECEKVIVKIPLVPNRDINQISLLRTNSISISGSPEFKINSNQILIEVEIKGYGVNLSNEEISKGILSTKEFIKNHFHSKNSFAVVGRYCRRLVFLSALVPPLAQVFPSSIIKLKRKDFGITCAV